MSFCGFWFSSSYLTIYKVWVIVFHKNYSLGGFRTPSFTTQIGNTTYLYFSGWHMTSLGLKKERIGKENVCYVHESFQILLPLSRCRHDWDRWGLHYQYRQSWIKTFSQPCSKHLRLSQCAKSGKLLWFSMKRNLIAGRLPLNVGRRQNWAKTHQTRALICFYQGSIFRGVSNRLDTAVNRPEYQNLLHSSIISEKFWKSLLWKCKGFCQNTKLTSSSKWKSLQTNFWKMSSMKWIFPICWWYILSIGRWYQKTYTLILWSAPSIGSLMYLFLDHKKSDTHAVSS